jgi:hypothetical protein
MAQVALQPAPARQARPARKRGIATWKKLAVFTLILLLGGELVCRAYWLVLKRTPLWGFDSAWQHYYPQIRKSGVAAVPITNTDATYDVLILGGSTISDEFGSIGKRLGPALEERLGRPVRVYNLGFAAHNSRDSLLKYRRLAHQRFDLVIAYDGINDARMNNAPPGKFKADYTHCSWYGNLDFIERHPWLTQSSLLFTTRFTADRLAEVLGLAWYAPRHNPPAALREHGQDIRTRQSFLNHYEEIVTTAQRKGEPVVLMTFAYNIPENYRLEDYANQPMDPLALAMWGEPRHVAAAIDEHNDAVRELAQRHPEVIFIDQQRLLPRDSSVFFDCCHFKDEGCAQFVQHLLAGLR